MVNSTSVVSNALLYFFSRGGKLRAYRFSPLLYSRSWDIRHGDLSNCSEGGCLADCTSTRKRENFFFIKKLGGGLLGHHFAPWGGNSGGSLVFRDGMVSDKGIATRSGSGRADAYGSFASGPISLRALHWRVDGVAAPSGVFRTSRFFWNRSGAWGSFGNVVD